MQIDSEKSGFLIAVLSLLITAIGVIIAYLQLRETPEHRQKKKIQKTNSSKDPSSHNWDAITPQNTKYHKVIHKTDSIPAGIQTIALEYDTQGHAHPLNLKGSKVRAEIAFDCRISNPMLALTVGNEYSMNFLPAHFLLKARGILEKYTLANLQKNRETVAKEIMNSMSDHFYKYGFRLSNVSIGALSKIS